MAISRKQLLDDIQELDSLLNGQGGREPGWSEKVKEKLSKYNKKPRQRKETLQALKSMFVETLYNDYYNSRVVKEKYDSYNQLMQIINLTNVVGHEREVYALSTATNVTFVEQNGVKVAKYKVKDENGNLIDVEIENPVFDSIDGYKMSHALLTHVFGANYRHLSIPVSFEEFVATNFANSYTIVKETVNIDGVDTEVERIVWDEMFSEKDVEKAIAAYNSISSDTITTVDTKNAKKLLKHYQWIDGLYQEISKDENGNPLNVDASGNVLHIDSSTFIVLTTGAQIKSDDGKTSKVKSIAEVLQKITGTTEEYSIVDLETAFNKIKDEILSPRNEFKGTSEDETAFDRINKFINTTFQPVLTTFTESLTEETVAEGILKLRADIEKGVYSLSKDQKDLVERIINHIANSTKDVTTITEEDRNKIKSMSDILSGYATSIGMHEDFVKELNRINTITDEKGQEVSLSNELHKLIGAVQGPFDNPLVMNGSTKVGRLALLHFYTVYDSANDEQKATITQLINNLRTLQQDTTTRLGEIINGAQTLTEEQLLEVQRLLVKPETLKEGETDNCYMTRAAAIYTQINEITRQITGKTIEEDPTRINKRKTREALVIHKRVSKSLYNQHKPHSRMRRFGSKFTRNFYWTIPVVGVVLALGGIVGGALLAGSFIAGQAAMGSLLAVGGAAVAVAGVAPITFGLLWSLSDRFRQFVRRGRAESRLRHLNTKCEKIRERIERLTANIQEQGELAQSRERGKLRKKKEAYDKELLALQQDLVDAKKQKSSIERLVRGKYKKVERKFYDESYVEELEDLNTQIEIGEQAHAMLTDDNETRIFSGKGMLKGKFVKYKKPGSHTEVITRKDVGGVDYTKTMQAITTEKGKGVKGVYERTLAQLRALSHRMEGQDETLDNPIVIEKVETDSSPYIIETIEEDGRSL